MRTVPSTLPRDQAVVLGAGIGGLLAAAALTGYFARIVVVERDLLPDEPVTRRGVPQATHVHALAVRGQMDMDALLPGFTADLAARGFLVGDFATEVAIHNSHGWARRFPSNLRAYGLSRTHLEWLLRRRVLAHPRVQLRQRHSVQGLRLRGQTVETVLARETGSDTVTELPADLVVDATGRSSRIDHWLHEAGLPIPPVTIVSSGLGYASRQYRPPGRSMGWRACYVQPGAPHHPRGAVLMPIEDDRWLVTLLGVGEHRPTHADDAFVSFAQSLHAGAIADAIADAEPLSPVTVTASTDNRRRHLDRLTRHPGNLICLGDSACTFNPLYAQGMSTAASGALVLARCLDTDPRPTGFSLRYHRLLARANQPAWQVATTADLRWRAAAGERPGLREQIQGRYLERVLTAATRSDTVQAAFLEVMHLTRRPARLLSPPVLTRCVLFGADRRRAAFGSPP
ncbi:FAD-dependent oxidoreductase [Actinomadura decatromicini]|uniref:FAD-dependent oxidoreductase n=1 Tax=Actinomadura decatromicini TaxID=2604572 RepID=UPI0016532020|nr:FAD-dependent monooxygenase [Actinomadura decatromicini]